MFIGLATIVWSVRHISTINNDAQLIKVSFTVADVISKVNTERMAEGLNPLSVSSTLTKAAELKALDMAKRGYFQHHLDGEDTFKFISTAGYKYIAIGENLGVCFSDPQELVGAWMISPGHRKNIMWPEYQDTGVAIVDSNIDNQSCLLVVQEFGLPTDSQRVDDISLPYM